MDWTGGCLCGDIRFKVNKDPVWAGHCHCTLCRRQTATAFTTGVDFVAEAFEWTNGKPVYFRDSMGVDRSFCPRCGSSMTWELPGRDVTVFVGSLDRADDIQPTCHIFTSTMLPWVKLDDDIPLFQEGDPGLPLYSE